MLQRKHFHMCVLSPFFISGSFKIIILDNKIEDGVISFSDMLKDDGSAYPLNRKFDGNKTAMLPYSSGTTGLPKGVMLSTRNIISNICQTNDSADLMLVPPATGRSYFRT